MGSLGVEIKEIYQKVKVLNIIAKFLLTIFVLGTLSFIIYYNRADYIVAYEKIRLNLGIDEKCSNIIYYIDRFDNRFGQSKEEFEKNLKIASDLWNNALSKKIFIYSSTSPKLNDQSMYKLRVNLIYDNRQETTNKLKSVGSTIEDDKEIFDASQYKYNNLKSQYEVQKKKLDLMIKNLKELTLAYEKDINYWNSRSGAPQGEYEILENRRKSLNKLTDEINIETGKINNLAKDLNLSANNLISLNKDINEKIRDFNTISTENGEEFEEGQYISDKNGNRINVYQYSNITKLQRVLAHEFGHALGITDHVEGDQSIMNAYNLDSELKLSSLDIDALKTVCIDK